MTEGQQRKAITSFALAMMGKLQMNMHKGGWENDSPHALISRVYEEVSEVEDEAAMYGTQGFDIRKLVMECADVANMAAMVAHRLLIELVRAEANATGTQLTENESVERANKLWEYWTNDIWTDAYCHFPPTRESDDFTVPAVSVRQVDPSKVE